MVILKKVKASTLMETLVASVLIVVVFMIGSMILNNLFSHSIKGNTKNIDAYLNELEYLYINDKLIVPFQDEYGDWEIYINKQKNTTFKLIHFEANNVKTKKTITKIIHENL